jgi:hypothetical protein
VLQTGGTGIERLTVICASVQEKTKWLMQLKHHVKVMPAPVAVKPQNLQVPRLLYALFSYMIGNMIVSLK